MAWIKTHGPQKADKDLREKLAQLRSTFPPEYMIPVPAASKTGESIVESHSLIPDALYHSFMLMSSAMSETLPLERRHHEMIATVVSNANDCHYWLESHAEFLRRVTLDDDLVDLLRNDYENAPISNAERTMCDFAILITKDVLAIKPSHHEELRIAGFGDEAVLQITLIAAWFNYINRVADALGVGRDDV